MKRYVCAVSTQKEYTLIGVIAFTEKGIFRKLKRVCKRNAYELEDRFGNNRFVPKFPDYLSILDIY